MVMLFITIGLGFIFINLNINDIQVVPSFVGYLLIALGSSQLKKCLFSADLAGSDRHDRHQCLVVSHEPDDGI